MASKMGRLDEEVQQNLFEWFELNNNTLQNVEDEEMSNMLRNNLNFCQKLMENLNIEEFLSNVAANFVQNMKVLKSDLFRLDQSLFVNGEFSKHLDLIVPLSITGSSKYLLSL